MLKRILGSLFWTVVLAVVGLWALSAISSPHPAAGPSMPLHPLVRINQLDPAQYASQQEYDTWAWAACSAAAMTEVINLYAQPTTYTIHDILAVERSVKEITPELGLLEDQGISLTVAHFGFQTDWGYGRSLDQVVAEANGGHPVIVGIPPRRTGDYPGGHLLVVVGGDPRTLFVADSSKLNRASFPRTVFAGLWSGFSAVLSKGGRQ
ncbi:MAG TPA: C39 family peptidase [Ktedonosporobacter sp.]|nr:C39 family peptidase [Ktedonosporobacter sp.]